MGHQSSNRRQFIKKTAAASAGLAALGGIPSMSAKSYRKILGSNDRLQLAVQGLGRRFGGFIDPIVKKENNVELVYLCDVMASQREKALASFLKSGDYKPKLVNDFSKVLDDKRIDAVILATPDHWHAPGAIMAMKADKHVYVEKPCSHNPNENELIVAAQQKFNKVVQMGNQQRSSAESAYIIKKIHKGIIGETYKAISFYVNQRPEVPTQKPMNVPNGLDWDLWQGPAPRRAYTYNTWDYNWHWYGWDYGTAEMGNNAIHELDIARWAMDVNYPIKAEILAAKNQFKSDGWTMYDTMEATYKFSNGKVIQWDGNSRNGYNKYGYSRGTIIYGSEGSVFVDRDGFTLFDRAGKVRQESKSLAKESGVALGGGGSLSTKHLSNFFGAIRGKNELNSPIAVGAVSQMMCHYANIAYRTNESLKIDENSGRILNPSAKAYFKRTYEPGWEPTL